MLCEVVTKGYKMEDKTIRNELLVLINYLLDSKHVLKSAFKRENSELLENILSYNFKSQNFSKFDLIEILLYMCTIDEVLELKGKG